MSVGDIKLRLSIGDLLTLGAGAVSAVAMTLTYYLFSPAENLARIDPVLTRIEQMQNFLNSESSALKTSIELHGKSIAEFHQILAEVRDKIPDEALRIALANSHARIESVEKKLASISDLIMDDPEKALSVTFLKKDLASLRETENERLQVTNQNIDRMYNMFAWSVGAILVSVLIAPLTRLVQAVGGSKRIQSAEIEQ